MRKLFDTLAEALTAHTRPGEFACASLESESSDFVRLNGARIRQAGRVDRAVARLRLVEGDRQAIHHLTLPGLQADADSMRALLADAMDALRASLRDSAPDPLLDVNRAPVTLSDSDGDSDSEEGASIRVSASALASGAVASGAVRPGAAFDRALFLDTVASAAGDADLVGFCAAGPMARGFCSSTGARLWYRRHSVSFDWSVHLPSDAGSGERKAVKSGWSGERFDPQAVRAAIAQTRRDAQVMARPVRRLAPGDYRALLSPRAVADLLSMLGWGGFSARAHHGGQSPLARLRSGEARFSALLNLAEDLGAGFAPRFQTDGYARPERVPLIEQGRFADWLVSPTTAREYGLTSNAAGAYESPDALVMSPGNLSDTQALQALGTGISLANLGYRNFSDRQACRLTGMTRFACLWVEDGEPVGPIEAMRFDDSLFEMLGDRLEALGDTVARMPATDTYDGRATGGVAAPGALVSAVRFAL